MSGFSAFRTIAKHGMYSRRNQRVRKSDEEIVPLTQEVTSSALLDLPCEEQVAKYSETDAVQFMEEWADVVKEL